MAKKVYKTTLSIDILTEDPVPEDCSFEDLAYQINEGDWIGYNQRTTSVELTGLEAANEIYSAGSEPGFFNLDDWGEELSH